MSRSVPQPGPTLPAGKWNLGNHTDLPLMNNTRASETEATLTLPVWPNPPDNEESAHRGQIFRCILKEWGTQVTTVKKAAAAEAEEEADKVDDAAADKDDKKLTSSKPR